MLGRLIERARFRLWLSSLYPDPDLVHRHGGLPAVVRYLATCGSPTHTLEVLERFGAKVHPEAKPAGPRITIHEAVNDFSNLTIGRSVHLGPEVFLDLTNRIVFEESASLGMRSIVLTHVNLGDGYPNKPTARIFKKSDAPTVFERGCSVGAGAIILKGVTIGEDAVVGAGVVVTRDVPPRTVLSSPAASKRYELRERWFQRTG